jgi:hypothetical protein
LEIKSSKPSAVELAVRMTGGTIFCIIRSWYLWRDVTSRGERINGSDVPRKVKSGERVIGSVSNLGEKYS